MVMQLTVKICTGQKNNMNTEKMTAVSKYMNILNIWNF